MPYEFTERPLPYEGRHRMTAAEILHYFIAGTESSARRRIRKRVDVRRNLDQVHHHGTRT